MRFGVCYRLFTVFLRYSGKRSGRGITTEICYNPWWVFLFYRLLAIVFRIISRCEASRNHPTTTIWPTSLAQFYLQIGLLTVFLSVKLLYIIISHILRVLHFHSHITLELQYLRIGAIKTGLRRSAISIDYRLQIVIINHYTIDRSLLPTIGQPVRLVSACEAACLRSLSDAAAHPRPDLGSCTISNGSNPVHRSSFV